MLEQVELTGHISKGDYRKLAGHLDLRLAELQRQAKLLGIPILIILEGWEGAGKGTLAAELLQPLDPRGVTVYSIKEPTQEERFRPFLWRFWQKIPAKGNIVVFDASWYHELWRDWAHGDLELSGRRNDLDAIAQFERQLVDRGMVLLKVFMHIDKRQQAKRFERLLADPATAWKVTDASRHQHKHFDDYSTAAEAMLEVTNHPEAPWTLVGANHRKTAHATVLQELVSRLEEAVERAQKPKGEVIDSLLESPHASQTLSRVDLSKTLDDDEYEARKCAAQKVLRRLQHEVYRQRIPVVIAFEGWDAAGKGGAIKRLTSELDPRGYEVVTISAPTLEEKAYPYWWRFWRRLPKDGHFGIFDRTWYGRLLVERIEGFCTIEEWQRAYSEINEFEAQLVHHGAVVVKFWLHVDADEQLRRFESRVANPVKQWKITDEDWRNREKWLFYESALEDMFRKTSTHLVPWNIVEANDKQWARVKVLETVCQAIKRRLDDVD